VTAEAAERPMESFDDFGGESTPVLLLVYDGTPAPFRVYRFQARPWPGVLELLVLIERRGRTRMRQPFAP
jgi:hypothetical protein